MPVRVKCPSCGKGIKAPEKLAGKNANCPGCKAPISIPPLPPPVVEKAFDPNDFLSTPEPPPKPSHEVMGESASLDRERMEAPPTTLATPKKETKTSEGLHKQRIAIAALCFVGMFGVFLPWVNAPIVGSVNGMAGQDGKITLGLFAAAIAVALAGWAKPISIGSFLFSAVPAFAAGALAAYKIATFGPPESSGNAIADGMLSTVSVGVGLFVVASAGLLAAVVPFFLKDK